MCGFAVPAAVRLRVRGGDESQWRYPLVLNEGAYMRAGFAVAVIGAGGRCGDDIAHLTAESGVTCTCDSLNFEAPRNSCPGGLDACRDTVRVAVPLTVSRQAAVSGERS